MRQAVVGVLNTLNLTDATIVGKSIGAVLALTVAAEVPDRVRAVYALNTYDYETRYGDGIRRGGWFSNLIIGSLQFRSSARSARVWKTATFCDVSWEGATPTPKISPMTCSPTSIGLPTNRDIVPRRARCSRSGGRGLRRESGISG